MATLLEKANQILNEKNTKIIPENIKKDVQIFDVIGTLEIDNSSDTIRYVTSLEALNNIENPIINDKVLVYNFEEVKANSTSNEGESFNYIMCPETITLPNTQEYIDIDINGTLMIKGMAGDIGIWKEVSMTGYQYMLYDLTTSDGNYGGIYTRRSDIPLYWKYSGYISDNYFANEQCIALLSQLKFINFKFIGVYYYDGNEWKILPNQLTATEGDLSSDKIGYGKSGLITGTYKAENYLSMLAAYVEHDWLQDDTILTRNKFVQIPKTDEYSIGDKQYCYMNGYMFIGEDLALYTNTNNGYFELYSGDTVVTRVINNNDGTVTVSEFTPLSTSTIGERGWVYGVEHAMESSAYCATNLEMGEIDYKTIIEGKIRMAALPRAKDIPVGLSYISIDNQQISGTLS